MIRASSGIYTVQSDGRVVHCSLRGNLKKDLKFNTSGSVARRVTSAKRPYTRDALSVGDRVLYSETHHGSGIIEEIFPRTSHFSRAGFRGKEHTLVSNLDQLCVVFACAEPRLDPWKLDRFLVAAESEELAPIIVANKRDLVSEDEFKEEFGSFEALGYRVIPTSVRQKDFLNGLCDALQGKISAFVGPSGAGKSSLLNEVQPGLNLVTAEIGHVTFKGRHTTTQAQLIPLRIGGWVADTPGLRNFDIMDLDADDLPYCFPEFKDLLGGCKFDNCRHRTEPGCAIKAGVDTGTVHPRRYESFLILSDELGGK